MEKILVVVADSSRARLFRAESAEGKLIELEDMAHPEGRLHETQMTQSLPGRTFDAFGPGRHAMEEDTPPKRHEAIQFAKRIGERVETARTSGEFTRLVLVADPRFLGLLRDNLKGESLKLAATQVDKNLVQLGTEDIRKHLPSRL
jgi:protein required for attachment to host cells